MIIKSVSVNTDNMKLFVICSGVSVADDVTISMLFIKKEGERLAKTFESERIYSKTTLFHVP